MEKLTAKINFLVLLGLGAILVLFPMIQSRAAESPLTCPLEKEVPIGQLINQTEQTVDKVLRAALDSLAASREVVTAGGKVYDLTDQTCQKDRCQPDCQKKLRQKSGTPNLSDTSICKDGYACSHYSPLAFIRAEQDNDPSIPSLGCENLPDGEVETFKDHWYEVVSWTEGVSGNTCDSAPDCGIYSCQTGYPVLGSDLCPTGCNWLRCSSSMNTWIAVDQGASYNHYDIYDQSNNRIGSCLVACEDYAGNSGECNIDWTEEYCQADSCSGQACDFNQLNQQKTIITTKTTNIINANNIIKGVFDDKIANLPLLGDVCKIPFFGGISCNLCGLLNLSSCKTEIETILLFFEKAMANDQWCYNAPEDYAKIMTGEKEGKFLLNCESLTPMVLEQCYPNNFYCCY